MKKISRTICFFIIPVVLLLCSCREQKMNIPPSISTLDYKLVLEASRQIIKNHDSYTNDWAGRSQLPKGAIVLDPKVRAFGGNVPDVIRNLHPFYIMILKDRMMIYLDNPSPRRQVIFAFAEGVEERGTYKLIDGLWYYNGQKEEDFSR